MNVPIQYDAMMKAFYGTISRELSIEDLLPFVCIMLSPTHTELLEYTIQHIPKDTCFHEVYDNIYNKKQKYFEKIDDPYIQFTLAWLYSRFH